MMCLSAAFVFAAIVLKFVPEYDSNMAEKNICSDNFLNVACLSSSVNSLGTIYGEALVSLDGKAQIEDYIVFNDYNNDFIFFTCERKIDNNTLKKIADSVKFIDGV